MLKYVLLPVGSEQLPLCFHSAIAGSGRDEFVRNRKRSGPRSILVETLSVQCCLKLPSDSIFRRSTFP